MQNLANEVQRAISDHTPKAALKSSAEKWATYALQTYHGELLNKALEISKAVANFLAELESQ